MNKIFLTLAFSCSVLQAQTTIWVNGAAGCAPLCNGSSESMGYPSPEEAELHIRGSAALTSPTQDVIVNIKGGVYQLTSPMVFVDADGMAAGSPYHVIYQAYNGEPVLISGGADISTSNQASPWSGSGNYWKKTLPSTTPYFRQLYVNGQRASRGKTGTYTPARNRWVNPSTKNLYEKDSNGNPLTYISGDGVYTDPDQVLFGFGNSDVTDIEVVWKAEWRNFRILFNAAPSIQWVLIGLTNVPYAKIMLQQPFFDWALSTRPTELYPTSACPFYVENALELATSPGNWYYKKSTHDLYYYPKSGEGPTSWNVIVPSSPSLIQFRGTATSLVHNVTFKGITFAYTNWNAINEAPPGGTSGGFLNYQAEKAIAGWDESELQGGTLIPGAVSLDYTDGVEFSGNTFQHLGGSGITIVTGNHNTRISGNYFNDISAAAISVGKWDHVYIGAVSASDICTGVDVSNNLIYDIGKEYFGSCGITVYTAQNSSIRHNLLTTIPYTGISSGYAWWNYDVNHGSMDISFNYINDFNNGMKDGGGIYTLGHHNAGTFGSSNISRNYIRRDNNTYKSAIDGYPWYGYSGGSLYLDQASRYIFGGFNVIEPNTNRPEITKRLQVTDTTEHDISINNNYASIDVETNNNPYGSTNLTGVNVQFDPSSVPDGNWKNYSGAWYTVSNSGLQQGYRYLLDKLPVDVKTSVANQPFSLVPIHSLLLQ